MRHPFLPVLAPVVMLAVMLTGCGHQFPQRPYVDVSGLVANPSADCVRPATAAAQATPERTPTYTLHFVEFDDHGWSYDNTNTGLTGPRLREGNPEVQLDCAMEHLRDALKGDAKVGLYVYVHGWHHNAAHGDSDVRKFRDLLHRYGSLERQQALADPGYRPRRIIGVYVGWDGSSMSVPYLRDVLTFYPRKASAHRVAAGRAHELFGRIKGLREFHNRNAAGKDCSPSKVGLHDDCKLRTVMIGHSFGGLILFSAVQPYLLATLTTRRDLTAEQRQFDPQPRSHGIADLVVLVNPAFEATMFEPVHRAALHYTDGESGAPLLVSLTSEADWAVGRVFPAARFFSSVFHYPANSDRQAESIRDTIGNVGRYQTHFLCLAGSACGPADRRAPEHAPEQVCDMTLQPLARIGATDRRPPIWNVVTTKDLVSDHNDIVGARTINFFEYAYFLNTLGKPPCEPVVTAAPSPGPAAAPSPAGVQTTAQR